MPEITIPKGVTLSELAVQHGTTVSELMRLNPQIKDSNIIRAGAKLTVPTPKAPPPKTLGRIDPATGRFIPEPVTPLPTPSPAPPSAPAPIVPIDRQAEIQRIRGEIAKITPQIAKLQKQLGIVQEAKAKGLVVTPKTTVEEAQRFLTEFRPPTIDEVDELPAQKVIGTIPTDINALIRFITQEMVRAREEAERIREEHKTFWERIREAVITPFQREEMTRRLEEETRIKELQAQREATLTRLTAQQTEADRIRAEQREALALSEARLAPMAFIRGEQARINERYQRQLADLSAEMGTTMALYQARTGQIEEAYRWVDRIVEARTWQEQFNWQRLITMERIHRDEINALGSEFRDWFRNMITLANLTYQEKRETQRQLTNWMIEYPLAGITSEDTLESAREKIMKLKIKIPIIDWELRTVNGDLYRVDPKTGRYELLIKGVAAITPVEVVKFQSQLDDYVYRLNVKKITFEQIPEFIKPFLTRIRDPLAFGIPGLEKGWRWSAPRVNEDDVRAMKNLMLEYQRGEVPASETLIWFTKDKEDGMPYEDALTAYEHLLGKDYINQAYGIKPAPPTPPSRVIKWRFLPRYPFIERYYAE